MEFYRNLNIQHITSLVEHPQTNRQAKAANKVILGQLKKRLDRAKGKWPEELTEILWAYRCTPQSSTKETPYSLVYGTDAMIQVEIDEPSIRKTQFEHESNKDYMNTSLDLFVERRERANIQDMATKLRAARN